MLHLDRLLSTLRIGLPGSVDPALKLVLNNVVLEFANETFAIQEDIVVPVVDGESDYDLSTETSSEIKWIMAVDVDGLPALASELPLGTVTATGKTSRYAVVPPSTLVLLPAPVVPLPTITARVAVVPLAGEEADPLDGIPDWVFDKFFTALEVGVLGKMQAQLAKPFTNLQTAAFHQKRFLALKTQALDTVRQAYTVAPGQRWQFPRWA